MGPAHFTNRLGLSAATGGRAQHSRDPAGLCCKERVRPVAEPRRVAQSLPPTGHCPRRRGLGRRGRRGGACHSRSPPGTSRPQVRVQRGWEQTRACRLHQFPTSAPAAPATPGSTSPWRPHLGPRLWAGQFRRRGAGRGLQGGAEGSSGPPAE